MEKCKFYLNGECQLLNKKCEGKCGYYEKENGNERNCKETR